VYDPAEIFDTVDQQSAARRRVNDLDGGFIDQNEPSRIKERLPPSQCRTRDGDVWPVLLGRIGLPAVGLDDDRAAARPVALDHLDRSITRTATRRGPRALMVNSMNTLPDTDQDRFQDARW
jgi:hypothetical protein